MTTPFFTVIIATWNRAPLLPRALASLRVQTFREWEAVIVDDGSTDGSEAVVSRFLEDQRFQYLKRPHSGLSAARNAGAHEAGAQWLTFLDSDDEYAPEHLETRARVIREHPDAVLIHGGYEVIGPPEAHFVPDARDPSRMIPLSECVVGGTFVIRADVFREVGGFPDVPYGMDFQLLQRITKNVIRCDLPTYLYHREAGAGMCEEVRKDPGSGRAAGPTEGT